MIERFRQCWPGLTLLLLLGLVFLPVLGFDFLTYDDEINVHGNPFLLKPTIASFLQFWQAPYEKLYIPLTYSLWWLLAQLSTLFPPGGGSGANPQLYHGANLFFHLLSVLICQRIMQRLLKSEQAGWAAAAVFALHPLQVEAVAWVTGLKDLLAGFLALLSFFLYGEFSARGEGRCSLRWGGAFLAYGCALLAKPAVVGLPLAIAAVEIFWWRRAARPVAVRLLPWLFLAAPIIWITTAAQAEAGRVLAFPLWWRPLIVGDAVNFYLGKLLFPYRLGADYGRTPQWLASQGWLWPSGLGFYLLAGFLAWKERRPWLLVSLGLFLIPLLPVLGVVPFVHQEISTVADRYLYLAMVGPALLVGIFFSRWPQAGARLFLALLLLAWAGKSALQVRNWENSLVFNQQVLSLNPGSWTAHANLGGVYHDLGRRDEARAELVEALRLAPDLALAHKNLGVILEEEGRLAEAGQEYAEAVRLRPDLVSAQYALGLLEAKRGNVAAAERGLRAALALRPLQADYHGNLAVILHGQGRRGEAAAEFAAALHLDPNSAGAHNGLGAVAMEEGRLAEAVAHFRTALRLEAGMAEAEANLRAALAKQERERLSP